MKIKLILVLILFIGCAFVSYSQKKTFSCINENGDILFSFESNYLKPYSNGLAIYKTYTIDENGNKNWGVGFIDEYGKIVMPPIYDNKDISKYGFQNEVSWVKLKTKAEYILIDKKGNKISENSYEDVGNFKNGLCAVYQNNKMGFVNLEGKEIISCEYYGDNEFHEGLIFISKNNNKSEYGFINEKEETVIPFIYEWRKNTRFENGECIVKKDGVLQIIDKNGNIIFNPEVCDNIHNISNELILAGKSFESKTNYGFIDKNNQRTINPVFENATNFQFDKSIVCSNGKYGVINISGEYIIPCDFDKISYKSKIFICLKGNNKSYYTYEGNEFATKEIQHIKLSNNDKYFPYRNNYNKWGYLNENGEIHISAQYDYTSPFSEGKAWVY